MSANRVILVRHGRTTWNADARFQGQTDVPLDDVGVGQARRTADALYEQLVGTHVRIVSSDLSRAAQTARALATRLDLELHLDERLREMSYGRWEGRTRDEIMLAWPEEFQTWRGGGDVRITGGESRSEAAARGASTIVEAEKEMDGGTLVIVSHGGTLRGAILSLLDAPGLPVEGLRNAHWAELQNTDRGWRLSRYNVC
ncbi:histidine phosphatase family protein [Kineosporia sp. J2-2]|uniref:Histidine phosphatase family protein n=1 Tax=Kineosporia corallincola TaxID=2835133 RepID=A0ABS5TRY2_9ACTN|nr:histidine phosphatase family protein [Kineosporia corallincola]MBT0773544.1 histidine phosphatase family protein [Kineosporia corallincola]